MGDCCGMSISADSPLDETRGPLALLLRRQYEFPFGINIVHFSIFIFMVVIKHSTCLWLLRRIPDQEGKRPSRQKRSFAQLQTGLFAQGYCAL